MDKKIFRKTKPNFDNFRVIRIYLTQNKKKYIVMTLSRSALINLFIQSLKHSI